jgi:resuscitation-promoting factor RpfA
VARKRPGLVAVRRVTGVVLLFLGLFVIFFGFGLGNATVSVVGLALMLLTFAPRLATLFRGTLRQWVVGTGRVVHVSDPPTATPYGRCQLEMVIDAPGLPQEMVVIREPRVPVDRWPATGMELPIEVAADDIRNVRILWPDTLPEEDIDPAWDDDQPAPVPAAPPPSHLSQSEEYEYVWDDEPASPHPHTTGHHLDDEIDFALDDPPAPTRRTSVAAGDMSPGDEGRLHRGVPLPHEVRARVPSPRPGPAPARRPSPAPRTRQLPPEQVPATIYPSANPAASGAIHRVGVTLLVADVARSATFYRDRLGFHEIDSGPDSVVLASGETRLVLRAVHEMDPVHRRVAHLNLEVGDIDAVYAELKDAGVRFTYPPRVVDQGRRLELWAAAFKDPDGHGIALTQWRPLGSGAPVSGPADGARQRP